MTKLAPNLFDRRFADLMEIGRAKLRSIAPEWTDHNAHDPGITLMELLAWVSEAQLYSLSRQRRDEREAYAALLGIAPTGTQPSCGYIWPVQGPADAVNTFAQNAVLPPDAVIVPLHLDAPVFHPAASILWTPGRITSLISRPSGGTEKDLTSANQRASVRFCPFGESGSPRDALRITFACREDQGINGKAFGSARWSLGVLADPSLLANTAGTLAKATLPQLTAFLINGEERLPVPLTDHSQGMLASGHLLFDFSELKLPSEFTLELRSRNGFPRPPRLLKIEANVIPIQQGRSIPWEQHEATGRPNWNFKLDSEDGLSFAMGEEPVIIDVTEASGSRTWKRICSLAEADPKSEVFEFDRDSREVHFGNGINGRIPPARAIVEVTYRVSDGDRGNVARKRQWHVAGFAGAYGTNLEAITTGDDAATMADQRRTGRTRYREAHALITNNDIEAAALALPLLEVARAWVTKGRDRSGRILLFAMRTRLDKNEPSEIPETRRWLDAIERSLAPQIPLGSRLVVRAPRYADFGIQAVVEAGTGLDPAEVQRDIELRLAKNLALAAPPDGGTPRRFGVPVSLSDVRGWLRQTPGVHRLEEVKLTGASIHNDRVAVGRAGLPRWRPELGNIQVRRPGGAR